MAGCPYDLIRLAFNEMDLVVLFLIVAVEICISRVLYFSDPFHYSFDIKHFIIPCIDVCSSKFRCRFRIMLKYNLNGLSDLLFSVTKAMRPP